MVARLRDAIMRDTRANQPAAGDVAIGTWYYVSDEAVTERSNGTTWDDCSNAGASSLDAVLAASSGEDTADALSGAASPDASNVFATMADVGGGGGGGSTGARYPVQVKNGGAAASSSIGATLGATPTGFLICLSVKEGTDNITSITQTNVTWTKVAESTASTAPHVEIWKGVISGTADTGITVAYSGSSYGGPCFSEWSGVTGTLDQSAVVTNVVPRQVPLITPTVQTALVVSVGAIAGYCTEFSGFVGLGLLPFPNSTQGASGGSIGYAVAFGFPGTDGVVLGTWANASSLSELLWCHGESHLTIIGVHNHNGRNPMATLNALKRANILNEAGDDLHAPSYSATSSDPAVASINNIDSYLSVTGVSAGTATITATRALDGAVATLDVTVVAADPFTISLGAEVPA